MKNKVILFNLIISLVVLVLDIFYIIFGGLWLKAITSFGFVTIGIINVIYLLVKKLGNVKYIVVMLLGLVLGMAGDVAINIDFMSGAIVFALGHIFYVVAYCLVCRVHIKDFVYGLALFIPSTLLITLVPIFDFGGVVMQCICVGYAFIISCMLSKAIANHLELKLRSSLLLVIGSALFCFSDLMLLFNTFSVYLPLLTEILCLITYYPAQCIIAHSIYHSGVEKSDN